MLSAKSLRQGAKKLHGVSDGVPIQQIKDVKLGVNVAEKTFTVRATVKGSGEDYLTGVRFYTKTGKRGEGSLGTFGMDTDKGKLWVFKFPETVKVEVSCTCPDYYFTWWAWNYEKGSHMGDPMPPYKRKTVHLPERNPAHIPGACKHILGVMNFAMRKGWMT